MLGTGFPSRVSSPRPGGIRGVGRWLPSPVGLSGFGVCEVGTWFPSRVSSPQPGVYEVGLGLSIAASSPLAHIKPVPAPSQAPASRISFVIISRNSAFTLRRSQFVDSLHMDISPNCTTPVDRAVPTVSNRHGSIDTAPNIHYASTLHSREYYGSIPRKTCVLHRT